MKYIPTVTNKFHRMDLSYYDEILLTPSDRMPTIIPEEYKGTILIDNGGFLQNKYGFNKKNADKHIKLCKKIRNQENCIFILPDFRKDIALSFFYIKKFLKKVKPKRVIIVDMFPGWINFIETYFKIKAEFYAISPFNVHLISKEKQKNYHIFSNINIENCDNFRSYDSTNPPQ